MPRDIALTALPTGVALQDASGIEGTPVKVAVREFTSSEDGPVFVTRLEQLAQHFLAAAYPEIRPSTVDHLLAVIRRDKTARVWVNECSVFGRIRVARDVKKGEAILEADVIDIDHLDFGIEFPPDAGALCLFSSGWRKGLFFDFGPLVRDASPRMLDIPQMLGSYMSYLRSQDVFQLDPSDWDYMLQQQWFPFISLKPDLRAKMVRFAKSRKDFDQLLPEIKAGVVSTLDRAKIRWESSEVFRPHMPLLLHAIEKFRDGDNISCAAILYPRVEGLMRTLHAATSTRTKTTQRSLSDTLIDARSEEHHPFNLLLPEMFRTYLSDVYFANFDAQATISLSRNSVGHGVADPAHFDEKGAMLGLLILDQLYFFLPTAPSASASQ